jgi:hypothetical protein
MNVLPVSSKFYRSPFGKAGECILPFGGIHRTFTSLIINACGNTLLNPVVAGKICHRLTQSISMKMQTSRNRRRGTILGIRINTNILDDDHDPKKTLILNENKNVLHHVQITC